MSKASIQSAAQTQEIEIDGECCPVHYAQSGAVTWRAWGPFRGRTVEATGRSASDALDKWRSRANYDANE